MRLSETTLGSLAPTVARPGYDRAKIGASVVHLGIGAFHRAHQAAVFDAAIRAGDRRWGIIAASLRSAEVHDQLTPQQGLYTLVERDGDQLRERVIGAVRRVIVAPRDPLALVAALADPSAAIVTLTVTEKGYKIDPVTGALLQGDPDLAADMASLERPRTAPGFLVAGLAARRAAGIEPFTAISCDNLPENGVRLRAAVLALAAVHDADLARWIAEKSAFPSTMVDRIVPATTAEDIATFSARHGIADHALVVTECFTQWVIEDRFCGPRPDFAVLGVQLTDAVAPWEEAKLRLLNGAHSGIAYLGGLAGIEYVHQFVARAEGRRFVESLWDEAQDTLDPPAELDIAAYRAALMARFANSALNHRTRQIAIDGSQKIPQRLLASIRARLAVGRDFDNLALAVAAWMRWQSGVDDSGEVHVVDDPLAAQTAAALAEARSTAERVEALLAIDAIFAPDLASNALLRATLIRQLAALESRGVPGVLG